MIPIIYLFGIELISSSINFHLIEPNGREDYSVKECRKVRLGRSVETAGPILTTKFQLAFLLQMTFGQ